MNSRLTSRSTLPALALARQLVPDEVFGDGGEGVLPLTLFGSPLLLFVDLRVDALLDQLEPLTRLVSCFKQTQFAIPTERPASESTAAGKPAMEGE